MRFLARASSSPSMFFGMPGSKTRMPTSSSSASGMCTVACLASIFGIGLVSAVTQPASTMGSASAAAASSLDFMSSPRANSARRFLVVVVFLPEPFLELGIRFLFGGLAQPLRNDVVVAPAHDLLGARAAAARALDALRVRIAFFAVALAFRATRGREVARTRLATCGTIAAAFAIGRAGISGTLAFGFRAAARIAFLGDTLLFFLQGLVEIAKRIIEAFFASLTTFFGSLRATRTF